MRWLRDPKQSRNQKGRRASLNVWMLGWVRPKIPMSSQPYHLSTVFHMYIYVCVHILISVNN